MPEQDEPSPPENFDSLPTQPWSGPTSPSPGAQPDHSPASPTPRRSGWHPPEPEQLQDSFPQYEIRSILGRGGMGAVYQGWQKSLDRLVAIKILPPGLEDDGANFAERFQREAKAMARFSHPGIVAVFDAGQTADGLFYFVMEYIEGTDVQKMVKTQGPLSPEHALAITAHVCDALAYAHKRGVIHRDIKPANVMVDTEGQVKIADFGLAKVATDDSAALVTGSHISMGTMDFMAPEALYGGMRAVDHRADLYAVGVMLYQMLTGEVPRGRFDMPSAHRPELDVRFDAIVDKAMQKDPDRRYATAMEIRADLDKILTQPVPHRSAIQEAPPPSPAPQADVTVAVHRSANRSKAPLIAVGLAVVIGGVIGGVIFFATQRGAPNGSVASKGETASPGAAQDAKPTSGEGWRNLLASPEELLLRNARLTSNGLEMSEDSTVSVKSSASRPDGAIRVKATYWTDSRGVALRARAGVAFREKRYTLTIRKAPDEQIILDRYDPNSSSIVLGKYPLPTSIADGADYTLELRVVGSKLSARLNGKVLAEVEDTDIKTGMFGISAPQGASKVFIKSAEYLPLG